MNFKKIVSITIFVILFPMALALAIDPGYPDTVALDSVSVMAGGEVAFPVYLFNDELLSGIELVFDYDSSYLQLDSFSLAGGRLADFEDLNVILTDSANLIHLIMLAWATSEFIPSGNGLLCDLFFSTYDSAGGKTFTVDTASWYHQPSGNTFVTRLGDTSATSFIYPEFIDGKIHVIEPPPSPDSVWVEKVVGSPGNTVMVNIYGYNSEPLTQVDLALEYSSDDIVFNDTSFVGTRGSSAMLKDLDSRSQVRQILITLTYNDVAPLEVGTGPLATILFDIAPTATDGIVTIDSTYFLGAQSLEFTLTSADGGGKFTPYFTSGYVDIKTSTDVEDHYQPLIPDDFALEQNVPNPFNPTTNIRFDLPRQSYVHLEVVNVLGQRVKTLINESLPAGIHTVTFDGKNDDGQTVASGVYFYRLVTEGFSQSRKMILLK
jgi:hypothetical protein